MKTIPKWARFFISFVIIVALFYIIGPQRILTVLQEVSLPFTGIALIFYIIVNILGAWKIYILLRPIQTEVSFMTFLRYYLYGGVSSLFLPANIGYYSPFLILRKKIRLGHGTAVFIIDKLISFTFIVLIGGVGFFIFFNILMNKIVLILILIIGCVLILSSPLFKKFLTQLEFKQQIIKDFFDLFFHYTSRHPVNILMNFLLTAIRMIVTTFLAYFIFLAIGMHVNPFIILTISTMEMIAELAPFTINGLGVKQSIGVYLYHLQGIDILYSSSRYILGLFIRYSFGVLFIVVETVFWKNFRRLN